jgi:glutathione S-transferase
MPTSEPRFKLDYWPIPFRGCFVSYLFAYRGVPLTNAADFDDIERLRSPPPREQLIPFMGPPVLTDRQTGRVLSQMPAIVLYVADELDLKPQESFDQAMAMKVLMDCNDVLMEICRYNGSSMWTREEWTAFRSKRLPRWLAIFEESLRRGHIGRDTVTFADIGVFALFGNMMRCLPELEPDVHAHAPGIHALCETIGAQPSLAHAVAADEASYGNLYCGGQIEASIREMLAEDRGQ